MKSKIIFKTFHSLRNFYRYFIFIKYPSTILRPDYFLQPFDLNIWVGILFLIITGNILILISQFMNYRDEERTLTDDIFLIIESLCNQSGNDKIKSIFMRIMSIGSRMVAIIFMGAFSAVITSFLTVEIPQIPFSNLEEFVENGRFKLILPEWSPSEIYFQTARIKYYLF